MLIIIYKLYMSFFIKKSNTFFNYIICIHLICDKDKFNKVYHI